MDVTKHLRLQRVFYRILYFVLAIPFRVFGRFSCKVTKPKAKTFLALTNHNNDIDAFYMAVGLFRHMRFVASAHLTRGRAGRILSLLIGPIPRKKGAKADDTVELIEENLKNGISVGMMPEGNRSWDGKTMFIPKRTALVAKESGAALVTYRLKGFYLRTPRWAKYKRRGPSSGELVREYSPEELAEMTVDEVYDAIVRDLYVNAFEEQKKEPHLYRGKRLAESIEAVLYLCPSCRRFGTIHSKGNGFSCSCGLAGTVDETGFLKGDLPFDNTVSWDTYQKSYLNENRDMLKVRRDPFFRDEHCTLARIEEREKTVLKADCSAVFYADRLEIEDADGALSFPLAKIIRFGAFRNQKVLFSTESEYYEILSRHILSGVKYDAFWRVLTGKPYL